MNNIEMSNIEEIANYIGDIAVEMTGDDYRAMIEAKHLLLKMKAEIERLNGLVA